MASKVAGESPLKGYMRIKSLIREIPRTTLISIVKSGHLTNAMMILISPKIQVSASELKNSFFGFLYQKYKKYTNLFWPGEVSQKRCIHQTEQISQLGGVSKQNRFSTTPQIKTILRKIIDFPFESRV